MLKVNKIEWKLILAISWWVDSICLLNVFKDNFEKNNLIIAHFNHNLRWKESDIDETFVKNIAQKNKIKFYSEKTSSQIKNEEEARDLRYIFLRKILKKEKAKYIVTAQHKDDQVETILFQLIRWTWWTSPMKEFSEDIWRPFLYYRKNEILNYAKKNNLNWREDSTNSQNIYTRNLIRNKIIPEIQKINLNFWEGLINFSKISSSNSEFILEQAKSLLNWNQIISRNIFIDLHKSLQRWIIKILNPILNFNNIEEVIDVIHKWIWKKQKHWFILENWIIKYATSLNNKKNILVLASSSPQRKRLMANIWNNFIIIPSTYEEKWNKKKWIEDNITNFARQKALSIARKQPWYIVIWCDTFVVHPKYWVYLKAINLKEAEKHLKSYSEEKIKVLSWISVIKYWNNKINFEKTEIVESYIKFWKISNQDTKIWLSKNEWQWRSGSFSIEWFTSNFVEKIEWCFFNIIWLPIYKLKEILSIFKFD